MAKTKEKVSAKSKKQKPCEIPCPKCGSGDVHRRFISKGTNKYVCFSDEKEAKKNPFLKFKDKDGGRYSTAKNDYMAHYCRCCEYKWWTLPLPLTRRTK